MGVDDKHRTHIPKDFRGEAHQLTVCKKDGKLFIYKDDILSTLPQEKLPLSYVVNVDKWGRFPIPHQVLEVFQDKSKAVFEGCGDHFECYS